MVVVVVVVVVIVVVVVVVVVVVWVVLINQKSLTLRVFGAQLVPLQRLQRMDKRRLGLAQIRLQHFAAESSGVLLW